MWVRKLVKQQLLHHSKRSYLLVLQNLSSFFLNFAYTWSNSRFLFLGDTVFFFFFFFFFVNDHGNWWGSNLTLERKIRRNIASFHKLCPYFFFKVAYLPTFLFTSKLYSVKNVIFCVFFRILLRKSGSISFYSLKINILM